MSEKVLVSTATVVLAMTFACVPAQGQPTSTCELANRDSKHVIESLVLLTDSKLHAVSSAILERLNGIEAKVDRVENRLDSDQRQPDSELHDVSNSIHERLNEIEAKVDRVENCLDSDQMQPDSELRNVSNSILERLNGIEAKVDRVENRLDSKQTTPGSIPADQYDVVVGRSRYQMVLISKTWENASNYCQANGGQLAVIDNSEKQEQISVLVSSVISYSQYIQLWLDGTDAGDEGNWRWAADNRTITFRGWRPGEPNNEGGQHCLALQPWAGKAMQWDDIGCTWIVPFICEFPL